MRDIPGFAFTSYYLDDLDPGIVQCTGDDAAYGSSGLWVNQAIPNTDPNLGFYYTLTAGRIAYLEAPGRTVADAAQRHPYERGQVLAPGHTVVGKTS